MLRSRALRPNFRRYALPAATCLIAGGLCFAPAVGAATFRVTTGVFDGTVLTEATQLRCLPFDAGECLDGAAGSLAALATSESDMTASAEASGQKLLRASANGSWSGLTAGGPPFADGTAKIVDEFMLVDTLGNLTEGQVSIHVLLLGSLSENRGAASYTLSAGLCDLAFPPSYGCLEINRTGDIFDGVSSGDTPTGFLSSGQGTLPFNTLLQLNWNMSVACGYVRDFGECAASLGQSAYWQDMTVLDGSGQPIPGIQIVSASGIDWRTQSPLTPIPVPAVGWLFASAVAALAGIGAARRRRVRVQLRI
jgi:hypothetical protein